MGHTYRDGLFLRLHPLPTMSQAYFLPFLLAFNPLPWTQNPSLVEGEPNQSRKMIWMKEEKVSRGTNGYKDAPR